MCFGVRAARLQSSNQSIHRLSDTLPCANLQLHFMPDKHVSLVPELVYAYRHDH